MEVKLVWVGKLKLFYSKEPEILLTIFELFPSSMLILEV
jgi:hypothetical protein